MVDAFFVQVYTEQFRAQQFALRQYIFIQRFVERNLQYNI